MKLATYHRKLGENVVFYKGDLKEFILNQISIDLIDKITEIDSDIKWVEYKKTLVEFLRKNNKELLNDLIKLSKYGPLVSNLK